MMIVIIILTLILAIASVSAAENVTDTDGISDTYEYKISSQSNSTAAGFSDLQSIIDTNYGGTVNLTQNYAYDSDFNTTGIRITDSITINGNGYTVDACGKSAIFNITASNVTIRGVTFINGNSTNGGALNIAGDNVKIENSTFKNNTAQIGGAIYATGENITVTACEFSENTAENAGCMLIYANNTSISDSKFINNFAPSQAGAIAISGIYNRIANSVFTNNSASTGGAILFVCRNSTLKNNAFIDNYGVLGGAVLLDCKNTNVTENRFINNSAYHGGGIYSRSDNLNIIGCEFYGNYANHGSAVELTSDNAVIKNSTFSKNTANSDGAVLTSCAEIIISESEFINNSASDIFSDSVNLTFKDNTFTDGKIVYGDCVENAVLINNTGLNSIKYDVILTVEMPTKIPYQESFYIKVTADIADISKLNDSLTVDLGNGYIINATFTDGEAVIPVVNNLNYGENEIVINYTGSNETLSTHVHKTIFIYAKNTISASNMTRGYNSAYDFIATFYNIYGEKLANTIVSFIVDSKKMYDVKTDSNGVAKLTLKLSAGKHTITAINNNTGSIIDYTTTIVKRIQGNSNVNIFYTQSGTYKFRVYGDDGKAVGKNVKVSVKFRGKTYTVKTDANGYVKFSLSGAKPTTYTVTAEYKGFKVSNKVYVKHVINAKKTTAVKKSAGTVKIKIRLKTTANLKYKTFKVKFKGKTYTLKTNKNGIAYFKVNANVFKTLKKGKTYTYKITYKNDALTRSIKIN